MIREVIFSDGGSSDDIHDIAQECGVSLIASEPGRGLQLQAGAAAAKGEWFLFLHADTALEAGWETALNAFIKENLDKVPAEPVAPEMKLPETPAAQLEPEISVKSVFGDAPTEGETNKNNDPQPI